ncbi:SpoIIE family protein phosphatase [Streptomyces sp. OF3]|uniref:SpoIIE family protein phosphatase n=1 Tax=Streptomyces alkaliterrae TaxID=2213162 RepID=A0A7W3WR14_9ACTN|nr:SpoIIE family protein phosphatase [Streptomyces alkaliterrae]
MPGPRGGPGGRLERPGTRVRSVLGGRVAPPDSTLGREDRGRASAEPGQSTRTAATGSRREAGTVKSGSRGRRSAAGSAWRPGARWAAARRGFGSLAYRVFARDRLAWLNDAATRIGTTLDLERTAKELADFAVPQLADGAAVDLLEGVLHGQEGERPGQGLAVPITRAMAVTAVPELVELEPDPVGTASVHPETLLTTRCLQQRQSVLISRMREEDYERVAPTRRAADKMRAKGVHSYLAVPLIARGVLLGTADFVRGPKSPPFSGVDLAVAEQLASRAALFVDNARLYEREREHVMSLQRSMLPRAMPQTPGLTVATSYAPAAEASGVGGDWYDVMALPGGRTALVIGDVMGHGLPAAATMGRLRAVSRTLMTLDIQPDRMLARLDLATRDLDDDQVATCLCAVHDPADASLTIASAGHPPPVRVEATGETSFVDVPVGAPLGAGVIPYDPARVTGLRGSRLVFYTDGLVKTRRDDVDAQARRLRAAAAEMDPLDLGSCPLIAEGPGPGEARFDEAVLLVADSPGREPESELYVWDLPEDGTAGAVARRLVAERLRKWDLAELVDMTELVVSELVGNALRYGGGPGQLRMLRSDRLTVEVSDSGPDLPQIQHADVSDEGGRGMQLINMLCRRWGSCRTEAGKIVWAEQDIPD